MRSKKLWLISGIVVLAVIGLFVSYFLLRTSQPQRMSHALTGYVLEVRPKMNRITVRNADVPRVMASMVMDYHVKDAASLAGIKPGDIIQATMAMDGGNWLEDIKVTGKR